MTTQDCKIILADIQLRCAGVMGNMSNERQYPYLPDALGDLLLGMQLAIKAAEFSVNHTDAGNAETLCDAATQRLDSARRKYAVTRKLQ